MSGDPLHRLANAEHCIDGLREQLAERDATIAALRADNAALRASLQRLLPFAADAKHRHVANVAGEEDSLHAAFFAADAILAAPNPGADLLAEMEHLRGYKHSNERLQERYDDVTSAISGGRSCGGDPEEYIGIANDLLARLAEAERERDALKAQVHDLYEMFTRKMKHEPLDMDAAIRFIRAQVAELQADKERLDWLANEVDREMRGVQIGASLFRRNQPIDREAIDANSDAAKERK